MYAKAAIALTIVTAVTATPETVFAQVAAEEAVILSGSSGTGRASSSLGSAVSGSINSAAEIVSGAVPSNQPGARQRKSNRRSGSGHATTYALRKLSNVNALEHTDAATYRLESGVLLRVSGVFHPTDLTTCVNYCPG